ncbi:hypothetical protein [Pelistega europaea]|uniref:Uncharacterized protein n=1 Tax=Pelistega europaea TaxID=106147 RepID=A0A7Y4LBB9_9BURK|nr:hypothetical protein [Pelistega europaea]NOL50372.1 hypothetical protein [Pelistega europaea]
MSRSYRKNPIVGYSCAESEKKDKQLANRKFRRRAKVAILAGREPPVRMREVVCVWSFAKDGKQYCSKETIKAYPSIMRK